ncbi:hypothetical protein SynA1560_00937 [Synechococcus sp. A15-60]|nr:hypothetical protein SynA1560_00937 [Synechococcus sp. A15-60]
MPRCSGKPSCKQLLEDAPVSALIGRSSHAAGWLSSDLISTRMSARIEQ